MIKILFVDDEANILAGLRRMLRCQRKVWDMKFANGGEEALSMFETEPFDVVVSDMRMPRIDGAQLLETVSRLYPNTVRLVLSGQSEHEKIFRAIGPAHQFMSKPCEPDVLISTIERACGLQSQLNDPALKNVVSQISSLPSLPEIYKQLVHELEGDDASIGHVGDLIEGDLAMTAKVLQLVNSSFFGLAQSVSCPKHAVSLLGLNIIRPLVLCAKVFCQYEERSVEHFSLDRLIQHGLAVAVSARKIAEQQSHEKFTADDAFIAAMLHDIGKLILAVELSQSYREAVELSESSGVNMVQAEKAVFGTTHAEVGAHLLGLWGLPNPIVEAVAFHHRPSDANSVLFTPLAATFIANLLHQPAAVQDISKLPFWDVPYLEQLELRQPIEQLSAFEIDFQNILERDPKLEESATG